MSGPGPYGPGRRSEPREVPGGRREVPFGPDVSWPNGFRQLDQESRRLLESGYGRSADPGYGTGGRGPGYRDPASDDYGDPGYSDPAYDGPRSGSGGRGHRTATGLAGLPAVPGPPTAPITAACPGITSLTTAGRPGPTRWLPAGFLGARDPTR